MLRGDFNGLDSAGTAEEFSKMLADPVIMTVFMVVIVLVCLYHLRAGTCIRRRAYHKDHDAPLFLFNGGIGRSFGTVRGRCSGLEFYLKPDFGKMKEAGLGEAILQLWASPSFTLSIGIGRLCDFGSYIGKEKRFYRRGHQHYLLDTPQLLFMSGLIISPACFAYGIEPTSGPSLYLHYPSKCI